MRSLSMPDDLDELANDIQDLEKKLAEKVRLVGHDRCKSKTQQQQHQKQQKQQHHRHAATSASILLLLSDNSDLLENTQQQQVSRNLRKPRRFRSLHSFSELKQASEEERNFVNGDDDDVDLDDDDEDFFMPMDSDNDDPEDGEEVNASRTRSTSRLVQQLESLRQQEQQQQQQREVPSDDDETDDGFAFDNYYSIVARPSNEEKGGSLLHSHSPGSGLDAELSSEVPTNNLPSVAESRESPEVLVSETTLPVTNECQSSRANQSITTTVETLQKSESKVACLESEAGDNHGDVQERAEKVIAELVGLFLYPWEVTLTSPKDSNTHHKSTAYTGPPSCPTSVPAPTSAVLKQQQQQTVRQSVHDSVKSKSTQSATSDLVTKVRSSVTDAREPPRVQLSSSSPPPPIRRSIFSPAELQSVDGKSPPAEELYGCYDDDSSCSSHTNELEDDAPPSSLSSSSSSSSSTTTPESPPRSTPAGRRVSCPPLSPAHSCSSMSMLQNQPKKPALKRTSSCTHSERSSVVQLQAPEQEHQPAQQNESTREMSRSVSTEQMKRNVSFGKLECREYNICISDHPACSYGPPIQLGWEFRDKKAVPVEDYEQKRKPRRRRHQMVLSYNVRRYLLLKRAGYSKAELKKAMEEVERVKRQRMLTDLFLPAHKLDEALEHALDNIKGVLFRGDNNNHNNSITKHDKQ